MLKCWYFNCKELVEEKKDFCSVHEELAGKFCESCCQPLEEKNHLGIQTDLLFRFESTYPILQKLQEKFPNQFQTEISQLLSQSKLTTDEQKVFEKSKKTMEDFFTEKGGKRSNPIKFSLCSNCDSEIKEKQKTFVKQNPDFLTVVNKLKKVEQEADKLMNKISEAIGKEEFKKIGVELEATLRGNKPTGPGNGPTNDNSAKIARLQQQIIQLQNQITNLENNEPIPNSPNPNNEEIERLKNELEETKSKIVELTHRNKSPGSPSQNSENPNLPLYLSLAAVGIILVAVLAFFLISAKKKKWT